MDLKKQFDVLIKQYSDNFDYLYEGALIDVMEQIHERMAEKNLSRTQFAQKLGCSNAYITKLLNGGENLTLKKLVQIAQVLDCSFDVALVPDHYEVKRYITFNSNKTDTMGYTQPLVLKESYEQQRYSPIAA